MSKWDVVRLGDVCRIVSGSTPKSHVPEYWNGHHNWVTPAELNDSSVTVYETERKITDEAILSTGLKSFPAGTVLLSSRAPIGKVAIAGIEMFCNQGFKNLICSKNIYNKYLFWFLKNKTAYLNSLGRGATFKEVSKEIVGNIEIPLPPLSVQKKIANVLDRAAHLRELRSRQLEKMDLLIKSKFIDMFGDPVTNPMGWEKVNVATICEIIDGDRGPNYPKQTEFQESGYCLFLNTGNVTKFGFDFSKTQFITMKKDETLRKGKLKRHDVVLTTRGTVGNLAYYSEEIPYENIRINSGMVILRELREMHSIFFIECFRNEKAFKKMMTGSAQPQLPITNLKKTRVISPPFHLQLQFADFVACAEEQKAAMRRGLEGMEMNCRALMQEYFG